MGFPMFRTFSIKTMELILQHVPVEQLITLRWAEAIKISSVVNLMQSKTCVSAVYFVVIRLLSIAGFKGR